MSSEQSINIEGDVKAWLANIGGTLIVHGNITLNQWLGQQPTTLHAQTTNPIFISYSRADTEFARMVYAKLRALGFSLWRDRTDMQIGEDWWRQIQEAIEGCDTMILCMSPEALNSPIVAQEWHHARQMGKRVMPVFAADVDFAAVPRWMKRTDWADFRDGAAEQAVVWERFVHQLNREHEPRKVPFMVDPLPADFVARPQEFEPIVQSLVDATHGAVAITAALKGAGGYGKTTLARAVAHDVRIQGAFDDGILWVTLGESVGEAELLGKVLDLTVLLKGERPAVSGLEAAKTALREAMQDRYILLIVDDVWRMGDLAPFLELGKNAATLVTTRNDHVLPANCRKEVVDAMRSHEAVQLLSAGLGEVTRYKNQLRRLAARLGEWALLVKLANGALRKRIQSGQNLVQALEYAEKALTRKGLPDVFEGNNEMDRNRSARVSLEVSLELLQPTLRATFSQLAIFPEDTNIPLTTLEKLWGIDDFETEERCENYMALSLLLKYDLSDRVIRLHDVVRTYLRDTHGAELKQWNIDFIRAYNISDYYKSFPDDAYLWRHIAYHKVEARQETTLQLLLQDFRWLQAKLNATDASALIADYDTALLPHLTPPIAGEKTLRLIQSALTLSLNALVLDKRQLASQLKGRLFGWAKSHTFIHQFLKTLQYPTDTLQSLDSPFNITHLQAGGALLRTLQGHTNKVNGTRILQDGRLLSWSEDKTLRLWDNAGNALTILQGHTHGVVGSLELTHGRLLSWDYDSLRLWQSDGTPLAILEGHTDRLDGVLELQDGRLLSWSSDKTLRLWDSAGNPLTTLQGHTSGVLCAHELQNGYLLSSDWGTVRLWDSNGNFLNNLEGNIDTYVNITSVLELRDGRFLSWGWDDKTLRLWDSAGNPLTTLQGHTSKVTGALELQDGQLVSWSNEVFSSDNMLCLWDSAGNPLNGLQAHTNGVIGALELRDRHLLSWSWDNTLRLWDSAGNPLTTLQGHTGGVMGALELRDGRLLSWSGDRTLRLWNNTGDQLSVLEGHTGGVISALELPGDRLLSWSEDRTFQLWDSTINSLTTLHGHTGRVTGALELQDGHLLSWSSEVFSSDNMLRLWNTAGNPLTTLQGHTSKVNGALELRDGRLLSWGWDDTLRLWDSAGNPGAVLQGHTGSVTGARELRDGQLLSWSDDKTLRLWDSTGKFRSSLRGHSSIVSSVLELRDGRVLSWGWDNTLRLWNSAGNLLQDLQGHTKKVEGALELSNGRLLSWSQDTTLRLWDNAGKALVALQEHTVVSGALELRDGRLLSWGYDSLRLWDSADNPLSVLQGHMGVSGALELWDGRLLSWGWDRTLRLWDNTGNPLSILKGHTGPVKGALVLRQGEVLSWGDDHTPHMWDLQTGKSRLLFIGDAAITCCTLLPNDKIVLGDEAGRVMFFKWVK